MNANNDTIENEVNIDVSTNEENEEVGKLSETQMKNTVLNQFTWTATTSERIRIKLERSKSLSDPIQLDAFDPVRRRIASIMSLSDFGGDVIISDSIESPKSGFW